jgi:hypothetical protein
VGGLALGAAPAQAVTTKGCTGVSGMTETAISETTVVARAMSWVSANTPYSHSCASDTPVAGTYRLDCSGFVSMAWGLADMPNTAGLLSDSRFTHIARSALRPGDALDRHDGSVQHTGLIVAWSSNDNGQHRYADIAAESDFGVGTIERTGIDLQADSYWSTFTPLRYVRLVHDEGTASVLDANSNRHVFAVDGSGVLRHAERFSGQSTWGEVATISSPVRLAGTPAVAYAGGQFNVYAIGTDQRMYESVATSGHAFSSFARVSVGSGLAGGLAAVSVGGNLHVFGIDNDHVVWHFTKSGSSWVGPQSLMGDLVGAPAVTYHGGAYHLYALGTNREIYSNTAASGGSWSGWSSNGAGGSFDAGVGDVFNGVDHQYADNASGTAYQVTGSTVQPMGGTVTGTASGFWTGSQYEVYAEGTNGRLYGQSIQPGTSPTGSWTLISGVGGQLN